MMDPHLNISTHHATCQQLNRSAQCYGSPFVCVCGQARREREATMSESDRCRFRRMRAVTRDFFADKPPGTSIEEHALAAYRQQLRVAVREETAEVPRPSDATE